MVSSATAATPGPVVVVTGPTSAGKTSLAIEIARRFDGEVVNADSMQVFRFMDIGTAKPTLEERAEVPHWLFDVEPFGETSVVLRAMPALLAGREPRTLLRDLARELGAGGDGEGGAVGAGEVRLLAAADRVFASLACHSARRAGDSLEPREQQGILDALDAIPWAPTCPHGRPVAARFDRAEIERRFSRR